MPLIEELPVTSTVKVSHGWAYVPDTGPIAAQKPGSRDRKRTAAAPNRHGASSSAKREKAIQQRLDNLNKENHKDGVSVPIPTTNRQRDKGRKVTSNVRRILAYQRTFAHYLADEEANHPGATHYTLPNVTAGSGSNIPAPTVPAASKEKGTGSDTGGRRRSGARSSARQSSLGEAARPSTPTSNEDAPAPRGTKRGRLSSRLRLSTDEASPAPQMKQEDTMMTDAPSEQLPPATSPHPSSPQMRPEDQPEAYPAIWDSDPFLKSSPSEVPPMPSRRVMQQLVSEPPLTYTAARAAYSDAEMMNRPPPRKFCGMCGYWGRVKCKKCEEWTCGVMECWRGHEGVCVMANVY